MRKYKKYIVEILEKYRQDCSFSKDLANVRLLETILARASFDKSKKYTDKKNKNIQSYLNNLLKTVLNKYKKESDKGTYQEDAPIWVCWWTGLENAPLLIKQCVKSIRKNAGSHEVHIITKDNYKDYLEIPDYIIEKVEQKKMCLANFSDYLRVSLLEKYGGLWLDATIYIPSRLPEMIFERELYTCKSPGVTGFVSNGRWTSYCIGGWKGNLLFKIAKECFEKYWSSEEYSIDYLLVDYVFSLIYDNNLCVRKLIDSIPIANMQRNDLAKAMVIGADASEFESIIRNDTILYKLSWREYYPMQTSNGQESIFSYFLRMDL